MTGKGKSEGKRAVSLLLAVILFFALSLPAACQEMPGEEQTFSSPGEKDPAPPVTPDHRFSEAGPVIVMFYNTNCGDCMRTLPFVQQYAADHPELEIHFFNIRDNFDYWKLFTVYKEAYGTGPIPVPAVFAGDRFLIGYDEITGSLDAEAREQHAVYGHGNTSPILPFSHPSSEEITLPLVITAALADGINPCAFSVLILLLFALSAAGSRKRMVTVGACFIASVFVFYFLSGLGIFYLIQLAEISRAIGVIAAAVAFILGAMSLAEGLIDRKIPLIAIPESKRDIIREYIRKRSVPGALVLGVLVGMFELPCTGGIYLAILSLISDRMTIAQGIPLLLVYNVFFVLPLVLILCAVFFGLPPGSVDRWREEHRRAVRVIMGLVLLGLGGILVSTFIG